MSPLAALLGVAILVPASPRVGALVGEVGYSLDDAWTAQLWRLMDRSGKPDFDGPLQQPFVRRHYPEYALERATSAFPLHLEDAWRREPTAARFWLQSIDEFILANRAQIKTRAAFNEHNYLGLRYDQQEDLETERQVLRVDFGFMDIAGSPLFVRLGLDARVEKDDLDAELMVGARLARGELRIRVMAFDPFTNASNALAEAREVDLEAFAYQQDLPLALTLEALSGRFEGWRVEAYGGAVLPQTTTLTHPKAPEDSHRRTERGTLGGALLEWSPDERLAVGASTLHVVTRSDYQGYLDPERERRVSEVTHVQRAYALARLPGSVRVETSATRTFRRGPADPVEGPDDSAEVRWLLALRAVWMPTTVVGPEVGLLRSGRGLRGPRNGRFAGTDHRLLTRCALQLGTDVWASWGVGWDLDDDADSIYDGGGMTLVALW